MMFVKPMPLPPICRVTTRVAGVSASNCGGLVPRDVLRRGHVVGHRAAARDVGERHAQRSGGEVAEVVVRAQAAEGIELLVADQRAAA
jgi:hypothetical protein